MNFRFILHLFGHAGSRPIRSLSLLTFLMGGVGPFLMGGVILGGLGFPIGLPKLLRARSLYPCEKLGQAVFFDDSSSKSGHLGK